MAELRETEWNSGRHGGDGHEQIISELFLEQIRFYPTLLLQFKLSFKKKKMTLDCITEINVGNYCILKSKNDKMKSKMPVQDQNQNGRYCIPLLKDPPVGLLGETCKNCVALLHHKG